MREFFIAVIVTLLVFVAGLSHALLRYQPYAISNKSAQHLSDREAVHATPTNEVEGTEFWPPLFGYRLKVTDTLVAAFTAFLFAATCALYRATRNLVIGADKTAERQLRAYVYVTKTKLTFNPTTGVWDHSFRIKNFGLSPAHDVRLAYKTQVIEWNDGNLTRPAPDEAIELGSMAPSGDFFDNDPSVDEPVTIEELRNASKAVYLNGWITYETIFGRNHRTNFCYYVGGDCPYSGGEMYADNAGNDAT
jgi:hypothetical protein